jgi:hypothetical protein
MLRLHRVGIGMFAATFGLIAARLIRWRRGRSICQAHAKESWKAAPAILLSFAVATSV